MSNDVLKKDINQRVFLKDAEKFNEFLWLYRQNKKFAADLFGDMMEAFLKSQTKTEE